MGHGEAFDWATERLGERAKPKANLPQGTQGCAGENLESHLHVSVIPGAA